MILAPRNPRIPSPIQTAACRRIRRGELSAARSGAGPSNLSSISGGNSRVLRADQQIADISSAAPTQKAYFTASLISPAGALVDAPICANAQGNRLPTTAPTLARNMYTM